MGAWKEALRRVVAQGYRFTDRSERTCIELTNVTIIVDDVHDHITAPISAVEKATGLMYPSLQELEEIMFMRGRSLYAYTYGQRLFNFSEKINQIDSYIIPLLRSNELSRRAIVNLYDPIRDSDEDATTLPCLIAVHFMVRDGRLDLCAYLRSNDLFLGFPADLYQLYVLQRYVAQKLHKQLGKMTVFSNSTHVFDDQVDDIQKVISSG